MKLIRVSNEYINSEKMYSVMNELFSSWLFSEMQNRNMTQADLVRASGLTRGGISNLLSHTRQPDPDSLTAIAKAFKLPPETVFRAAGILPQVSEVTAQKEQFLYLFDALNEKDRQTVLDMMNFLLSK